jgi:hypothetical protein
MYYNLPPALRTFPPRFRLMDEALRTVSGCPPTPLTTVPWRLGPGGALTYVRAGGVVLIRRETAPCDSPFKVLAVTLDN